MCSALLFYWIYKNLLVVVKRPTTIREDNMVNIVPEPTIKVSGFNFNHGGKEKGEFYEEIVITQGAGPGHFHRPGGQCDGRRRNPGFQ